MDSYTLYSHSGIPYDAIWIQEVCDSLHTHLSSPSLTLHISAQNISYRAFMEIYIWFFNIFTRVLNEVFSTDFIKEKTYTLLKSKFFGL
jgi:hypothetical protein